MNILSTPEYTRDLEDLKQVLRDKFAGLAGSWLHGNNYEQVFCDITGIRHLTRRLSRELRPDEPSWDAIWNNRLYIEMKKGSDHFIFDLYRYTNVPNIPSIHILLHHSGSKEGYSIVKILLLHTNDIVEYFALSEEEKESIRNLKKRFRSLNTQAKILPKIASTLAIAKIPPE